MERQKLMRLAGRRGRKELPLEHPVVRRAMKPGPEQSAWRRGPMLKPAVERRVPAVRVLPVVQPVRMSGQALKLARERQHWRAPSLLPESEPLSMVCSALAA